MDLRHSAAVEYPLPQAIIRPYDQLLVPGLLLRQQSLLHKGRKIPAFPLLPLRKTKVFQLLLGPRRTRPPIAGQRIAESARLRPFPALPSLRQEVIFWLDLKFHHARAEGGALRPAHGQEGASLKIREIDVKLEDKIAQKWALLCPSGQ